MSELADGPLAGVRIVDFTRVMSGPLCTAMFADLGAEVIKIEEPVMGDITRHVPPFVGSTSSYFAGLNRNKKSISLDLKSAEGRQVARDLVNKADVVVENFRPGVMKRLGLDWAAVSDRNKGLIYASISGFGQDGMFSARPAYDLIIQAMSGLMHTTGPANGSATAVGESIADASAGVVAAWAIMVALFHRTRTGQGRYLDVAMLDSLLSMMATNVSVDLNAEQPLERRGNRHPSTGPVDSFSAADGDFVLVCFGDRDFQRLAGAIGQPGLTSDPRFSSNDARVENEAPLKEIISQWAASRDVGAVIDMLRAAEVSCAPIWSLRELASCGFLKERGLTRPASDNHRLQSIAEPVDFGGRQKNRTIDIPRLGQHSGDVLRSVLGYDQQKISQLSKTNCFGESAKLDGAQPGQFDGDEHEPQ